MAKICKETVTSIAKSVSDNYGGSHYESEPQRSCDTMDGNTIYKFYIKTTASSVASGYTSVDISGYLNKIATAASCEINDIVIIDVKGMIVSSGATWGTSGYAMPINKAAISYSSSTGTISSFSDYYINYTNKKIGFKFCDAGIGDNANVYLLLEAVVIS